MQDLEGSRLDPQGVPVTDYFDSPAHKFSPDGPKAHHTDRFTGLPLVERWTNAKAGYIGYLTGRGYTSVKIAKIMADGVNSATVRGMWRRWGLPRPTHRSDRILPIEMTGTRLSLLSQRAKAVGLTPNEFARRVLVCVVTDDLYHAVVDDKFDKKPGRADQP